MSNIIDSIQLSGVTYDLVGSGGGEGTVSALTETNPVVLKGDYSTYYTATTIDTIYVMSTMPHSFNNYYVMQGETSNSKGFDIIASGDKNGITSIASSTAFTSTVSDGIAKIEFVIPLELRRVRDVNIGFICYYFPPTPYASGSTSDVVEGAVYNSLRQLSLGVMAKDSIASVRPYLSDNGLGIVLTTDKGSMSRDIDVSSPTINTNGGKLNTQFSSSTASQVVLNSGRGNYCQMFYSKSYDDLTITFNPSYTGGETSTLFRVKAVVDHNTYSADFTYDITGNSVSYDNNWSTYFTTVDTLSTDHKLKIIPNTGYKIAEFMSYSCMIGGVDNSNPNSFITNLVTTTSNIHDGQEVIDDLYANKQDKLSAGTGINITNNVISATGGGGGITSGEVQTMIDESVSGKADTSAVTESLATKVNVADNNVLAFSGVPLAINVNESYKSLQLKTIYIKNNDDTQHSNVVFGVIRYHYDSYDVSTNISGSSIPPSGITTITNTDTTAYTFTLENGVCRIDFLGSCYFSRLYSEGDGFSFYYIHNNNYTSGQSSTVIENTVYDALTELGKDIVDMNDSGRFVNVSKAQDITGNKTFIGSANTNNKPIVFKQSANNHKIGFSCQNTASTEIATFEFRPNTYTDSSSVSHPLLYLGHFRNTSIANAGVVQTMVGFRQYDQKGAAAYHYLMPLPAEAKTPFSLTASFKNYFAPLGFKNGSTMITADNTGVVDFSDVLGGLKLVKLTQSEYDNLGTKDDNTVYFIGDSTNGYTMKIGNASVN